MRGCAHQEGMSRERRPSSRELRAASRYTPRRGDLVWAHVKLDAAPCWRLGVVQEVNDVQCEVVVSGREGERAVHTWRHRVVPRCEDTARFRAGLNAAGR